MYHNTNTLQKYTNISIPQNNIAKKRLDSPARIMKAFLNKKLSEVQTHKISTAKSKHFLYF